MKNLKKFGLGLVATSAAAGVFFASDAAVANAMTLQEVDAAGNPVPNGVIASDEVDNVFATKEDAIDYANKANQQAEYYTKKANAANSQVTIEKGKVAQAEGDLAAAQADQANKQAVVDASEKKTGKSAADAYYAQEAYDKAMSDAAKKETDNNKAAADARDAARAAEKNALHEAGKKLYGEEFDVNSAIVSATAGDTARDAAAYEASTAAKTGGLYKAYKDAEAALTTAGAGTSEDLMKSLTDTYNAAKDAYDQAVKAFDAAAKKYNAVYKESGETYDEKVLTNKQARNAEEAAAKRIYEVNDSYQQKGLIDAYKDLATAKAKTAQKEAALRTARINLDKAQNDYAINSAKANLWTAKSADAILGANISINEDLKDVSADQKKNLEKLLAGGTDAIDKQMKKAIEDLENAEKAKKQLKGEVLGLGDEKDPNTKDPNDTKDPNENPDGNSNNKDGKTDKTDNNKDGKTDKTGNKKSADKKADGKKAKSDKKADKKTTAKTGAVASVAPAVLGLALASVGSAFAFKKKED